MDLPILLKTADDISTDEIMPAGARVLPYRSNIPRISEFAFDIVDPSYPRRAREAGDHAIIGGRKIGQRSSREHAALAPRYLGLRVVIAKGFSRIHWQNLVNFGILPLTPDDEVEYDRMDQGDILQLRDRHQQIRDRHVEVWNATKCRTFPASHALSERQIDVLFAGG